MIIGRGVCCYLMKNVVISQKKLNNELNSLSMGLLNCWTAAAKRHTVKQQCSQSDVTQFTRTPSCLK